MTNATHVSIPVNWLIAHLILLASILGTNAVLLSQVANLPPIWLTEKVKALEERIDKLEKRIEKLLR